MSHFLFCKNFHDTLKALPRAKDFAALPAAHGFCLGGNCRLEKLAVYMRFLAEFERLLRTDIDTRGAAGAEATRP